MDLHSVPTLNHLQNSNPEPPRLEWEEKDPGTARKVQKADREKMRRDRLNEQFLELGNTLDPDRPKNDKAMILIDTIQVLKDLTTEVNRLKDECTALSEESRELMQEKNELREEKVSLKSDIESLNVQYQQRLRVMSPWPAVDPSAVMGPPYSYPVPVAVPSAPIPMHPSLQPFPFFGNQAPGTIPSPCSTFIPYPTPSNPQQQPACYDSGSHTLSKQDSKSNSANNQRSSNSEKCNASSDVATNLELKMPGSAAQQDMSSGRTKGKQLQRKQTNITDDSSSSRYGSSSQGLLDSSSNRVGDALNSSNRDG